VIWELASSTNRGLLSIGVFFVIIVVSIVLGAFVVGDWWTVPPMIITLCGCWTIVLGGLQTSSTQRYGRSAFSLFGWGLLLVAVGGAWFLYSYGWIYSLAVVLLVLGALAIAAAFRKK
jgi:hypothetical protein